MNHAKLKNRANIFQKFKGKKRNVDIKLDPVVLLNVIFVLIVLALHHSNYTYDYIWPLRHFNIHKYMQKLAVGGFLFLSGYKLTASKKLIPPLSFLANRFVRIYPPYFLALIAHSFTAYPQEYGELPSINNFLFHASLLQSLSPGLAGGNYLTLWFVSVLLFCYLFFIGTRRLLDNPKAYVFYFLILATIICVVRNAFAQANIMVFTNGFAIYLAFFASGMLYSVQEDRIQSFTQKKAVLLLGLPIVVASWTCLIASFSVFPREENIYLYTFRFLSILITTVPFFLLILRHSHRIRIRFSLNRVLTMMSFSSFLVFLFHRPIWSAMENIWPARSIMQSSFILLLGLPTIFGLSYLGQSIYKSMLDRFKTT